MITRLAKVEKINVNKNWLEYFEKYGVQFVVLSPSQDRGLVEILRRQPEWLVDLEDHEVVVFTHSHHEGKRKGATL